MSTPIRRATRSYRCARCGYTKTYPNAGAAEARHWFGLHSCQRHERLALRDVLAEIREAAIDRTPQPCLHKQANHQHGTNAAYVLDKCRCHPCAQARADIDQNRKRMKAYGRYNKYVNAYPVRLHLAELKEYGIGLKQVSKLSGVSNGSLTKIWYGQYGPAVGPHKGCKGNGELLRGPARRVLRTTAERIYAIEPIPTNLAAGQADHERTPRARLHLQSLVALGWSQSKLGQRLGIHPTNMRPVIQGERILSRGTVDSIETLYDALSMTLPPESNQRDRIAASRSRNYAREHGWLPPLALDEVEDEWIDDDELEPAIDEVAVQRALDGDRTVRLTKAEREEIVRLGRERGISLKEIRARTGLKPDRYIKREAS